MKLALCFFAAFAFGIAYPQTKWRVELPGGRSVIGATAAEARARASRLLQLEGSSLPHGEPKLDSAQPTINGRIAEERVLETLERLTALQELSTSPVDAVKGEAQSVLKTVKPGSLDELDAALERVIYQDVLEDLSEKREPSFPHLELISEQHSTSSLERLPEAMRLSYLVLIERIEGLRKLATSPAAVVTRQRAVLKELPFGTSVRLVVEDVKVDAKGSHVRYSILGRGKQLLGVDRWLKRNDALVLQSTSLVVTDRPNRVAQMKQKLLVRAQAELKQIQENLERQKLETEKRLREIEEAEKKEKERLRREQEARAEAERREREAKQRREQEERQRKLDQYRQELDLTLVQIQDARENRERASRSLRSARDEISDAERDLRPAKARRDEVASKLRQEEQNLEQAKREGRNTKILESIVRELKDQLRGADQQYGRAKDRLESAERQERDLRRIIDDLEGRERALGSNADQLRNMISALGG